MNDLFLGSDFFSLIYALEEYKKSGELNCDKLDVVDVLGFIHGKASGLLIIAFEVTDPASNVTHLSYMVLCSELRGSSVRRRQRGFSPVGTPSGHRGPVRKMPEGYVVPLSAISFGLGHRIGEAAHPGPYSAGGASSSVGPAAPAAPCGYDVRGRYGAFVGWRPATRPVLS